MKNFVQDGNIITVVAPYALASGDGAIVGSAFGVATGTAANGAQAEIFVGMGVVALTALTTDTGAVGTKMYWDNAARRATVTLTGNALIGVLTVAKTASDATATIRLNGVSV